MIRAHRGFINQYLGDAVMAIFPEEPADALKAAIGMQRTLETYNAQRQAKSRIPIRMGIGMQTGPLVMGIIGDQQRLDAATIADTVNTAARIESLTKRYGANLLLGEDSLSKSEVGNRKSESSGFTTRYLGQVRMKGKEQPIGIYECIDADPAGIRNKKQQTVETFDTAMGHFIAGEFPEASAAFNQVIKANPDDVIAKYFFNRAARYMVEGSPEGWTGVEAGGET